MQVPVPINHGQQGCRQKADRKRQRLYLVTEIFHHVFVVANVLFDR
jgi:hypothetical protein